MNRANQALVTALALAIALSASVIGQEADVAGSWAGEIEQPDGEPLEVRVALQRGPEGEWLGTLLMPDRQRQATDLRVSVTSEGIRFGAPQVPGAPAFTGKLLADGSRIEGSVSLDTPPPPPGTDIYLFGLTIDGGTWRLSEAVNITDRDGYDNQPRFLPDGSALLYTSIHGEQADIYRYEVDSGRTVRVTTTETSEYSPTPLPDGSGFSTVRVEDDGTQRLWSFDLEGGQANLVLPDIKPVGYHGWLDGERLGLFVLGEPPTLVLAAAGEGSGDTVAENIGRSIHVTPDGKAVSFVHKASEDEWTIDLLDLERRARRTLIPTRAGSEDFIWTPGGGILMGEGSGLFACSPGDDPAAWRQVADLATSDVAGITRLAMSSDSSRLAVVGARPQGDVAPGRASLGFSLTRQQED
jgi:hypothetical protein